MTGIATSPELSDLLDGCLAGLNEEIVAVRQGLAARGLGEPLRVSAGRLVDESGALLYDWILPEGRHDVRANDAARVASDGWETTGFVVAASRRSRQLRVAVSDWLGRSPGAATMEFDPTWLLGSLGARLESIRANPGRHHPETLLRLFGRLPPGLGTAPALRTDSAALNPAQREALERILGSEVQFVWGPPGTGKTRLLGHAVAELASGGNVLVTAVTNGAVDEAASRVASVLGGPAVRAGRIVRVGATLSRTGDPSLSLAAALERRVVGGRLARTIEALEYELGVTAAGEPAALSLRSRMNRLLAAARRTEDPDAIGTAARTARELQLQSILALREADVVLTTFARLALWDELAALRFGSLVIDEASAAPLPYVALAASRAEGRAVAIGDFQQLPAVVASRGEVAGRWLSRDIFREAGIVEVRSGDVGLPSPRDRLCAMLDEQYRMSPPIRRLVSELFYGGRLRDAPEVLDRPRVARPLVLIDTGDQQPSVVREEGSRANPVHRRVVVRLLEDLAACGMDDIAVVAPYRLHVRQLGRAVRDQLGPAAPRGLEIATIHRFQGREKSVVVFDTVDAPPGASWFLHEGRNPDLPRLVNVALSRARDALVLVAAVDGLRSTLPSDALVNRLLERVSCDGCVLGSGTLRESVDPGQLWGTTLVDAAAR